MSEREFRKINIYLTQDVSEQIRAEAKRQNRSMSWLIRKAWKLSYGQLLTLSTDAEPKDEPDPE